MGSAKHAIGQRLGGSGRIAASRPRRGGETTQCKFYGGMPSCSLSMITIGNYACTICYEPDYVLSRGHRGRRPKGERKRGAYGYFYLYENMEVR